MTVHLALDYVSMCAIRQQKTGILRQAFQWFGGLVSKIQIIWGKSIKQHFNTSASTCLIMVTTKDIINFCYLLFLKHKSKPLTWTWSTYTHNTYTALSKILFVSNITFQNTGNSMCWFVFWLNGTTREQHSTREGYTDNKAL